VPISTQGGELVVGAQIAEPDPQPSGHVPATHFIGVAFIVATRTSECAGSTRTMEPPWLLAVMAMLPRMMKASPPNMFSSVS
jgi:hypothetical protein